MKVVQSSFLRPTYLEQGNCVALVAPAGRVSPEVVQQAVIVFEGWGLTVEIGQHVTDSNGYFAASDQDRAADLQYFLLRPEVRAIVCLRGGYGCIRTMMHLDCKPLLHDPKWLVGFSDITVFHSFLNSHLQVESLHASMPINFDMADEQSCLSVQSLRQALFGQLTTHCFAPHALNVQGYATGRLLGGNLSVLQSIAGTPFDLVTDGAILFIEDLGEYIYHIDRMMMNLLAGGKLSRLAGLLVGSFTNIKDTEPTFNMDVYQLIVDHMRPFGVPVALGFPAGHQEPNMALFLGRKVCLSVEAKAVTLTFE